VKNEFGVWYIVVGVLLLIDMFNLLFMNGVLFISLFDLWGKFDV